MKKLLAMSVVLAIVLLISGCFVSIQSATYTVSGSVSTSQSVDMYTPANLSIVTGGNTYATSISMPPMDGSGNQVGTYSIADLPGGETSTITLVFLCDYTDVLASYSLDGGSPSIAGLTSSRTSGLPPYQYTVTLTGYWITENVRLDMILN